MHLTPMLAYNVKWTRVDFPVIIQPKLNGLRAMAHDGDLVSRTGKLWAPNVLAKIHEELKDFPFIIDGEIYTHGMSLQDIFSRASPNRKEPHPDADAIEFHVFDMADSECFSLRYRKLLEVFNRVKFSNIKLVEARYAKKKASILAAHNTYVSKGYEGTMVRLLNTPYSSPYTCRNAENRSYSLQKVKDRLDMDAEILSVKLGNGKHAGLVGGFIVRGENGKVFNVGSGLTDLDRSSLFGLNLVGSKIKVAYEMLSADGIPLKPTIVSTMFDLLK